MPSKSSSLILPAVNAPTASNARDDGEVLALPLARLDGAAVDVDRPARSCAPSPSCRRACSCRSRRRTSTPSIAWPLTAVSIASAITSRDTSEYFIASVPMPMPSVTVGTPNTCGIAPAASSAAIARSTSGWMPALQGFMVEWPLATPTIGLSKSPSPKPTARSIARLGERATPWVMSWERRLAGCSHGFSSWRRDSAPARGRSRPMQLRCVL